MVVRHDSGAIAFLLIDETAIQSSSFLLVRGAKVEIFLCLVMFIQKLVEDQIKGAQGSAPLVRRNVLGVGDIIGLVDQDSGQHRFVLVGGEELDLIWKARL